MMDDTIRLIDSIRAELTPVGERLLTHPYVTAVEEGRLQATQLRPSSANNMGSFPATCAASPTS